MHNFIVDDRRVQFVHYTRKLNQLGGLTHATHPIKVGIMVFTHAANDIDVRNARKI